MKTFLLYPIGFLLLLLACRPAKLAPEAYKQWVEDPDNGLQVSREMGEFRFLARLMPADYWALTQSDSETATSEEQDTGIWYVHLRIESKDPQQTILKQGVSSEADYQRRLTYFNYEMQRDLFLIQGKDSTRAVLYHHEQSFGMAPFSTCLIAFESHGNDGEGKALLFDDHILGVGPIKFSFSPTVLARIPQLNL